jgi:hypothetical protein
MRAAQSIYGLLGLCVPDALPSDAAPPSCAPIDVTALTGYEARNGV